MRLKCNRVAGTVAVGALLTLMGACSDDVIEPVNQSENSIPGQDVGIRQLKVSIPRLKRFEGELDPVSCRIHLRGINDRVTFPINSYISADADSIYLEADDPILAELPHQMYHLNAITWPRRKMTTRDDDTAVEDTVLLGARLSIVDPDNIRFRSSFNVGANSIGSGTEEDPWIIASGDDFMLRISDPMTRGETHTGQFFEITRNINLNTSAVTYGKGWEPAGHNNINGGTTDFNGTINGSDNYIENLFCFTDAGCGGLFYSLGENARIHNLEMRRVMLDGNKDIGSIACFAKKGCRLDSIQVNGTMEGNQNIGGLIGSGDAAVSVCISSVDISSSENSPKYIGGMIGRTRESSFTDCLRSGRIDASNASFVGGFVGEASPEVTAGAVTTFNRCYVSGSLSGREETGGFAGNGCVDFTQCYAGATLPQDSYAYTIPWDIFNINNMRTPMPLEVTGNTQTGGFVGASHRLTLHGENSFLYSSPAKPSISGGMWAGALAGQCHYFGEPNAKFISNAYVRGEEYVGGVMGEGIFHSAATFENYGNVSGTLDYVGGVIGNASSADGAAMTINCKNTGNVQGRGSVGGVIGACTDMLDKSLVENDGNVTGTGDNVGGLFGLSKTINLLAGSHVSYENGSLKISGKANVGGISGKIRPADSMYLTHDYCPVYANILSSGGCAGGLFGYAKVGGKNLNCYMFKNHSPVKVSITVTGGDNVGGAIGYFYSEEGSSATINHFDNRLQATITTSGNIAGGIVGRMVQNGINSDLWGCHSWAKITSTATSQMMGFGGLAGMFEELTPASKYTPPHMTAINCSFHGSISGANATAAGGIVGHINDHGEVKACYNAGRVDAIQAVGGIVGRAIGSCKIENCFNMGEVPSAPGREWLAGILGQKEDSNSSTVTISSCYNVGQTGWGIIGGEKNSHYSISNCYYLDSASSGDMKKSGSQSRNADQMRKEATYNEFYSWDWEFHEGVAAPTLLGVPMFDERLPLQK